MFQVALNCLPSHLSVQTQTWEGGIREPVFSSPSLEFCGLPDQAKEHTWGWMGMWGSAGVRKWKGNGKEK